MLSGILFLIGKHMKGRNLNLGGHERREKLRWSLEQRVVRRRPKREASKKTASGSEAGGQVPHRAPSKQAIQNLLLLSSCGPLCWARSWWAALRAAFLLLIEISVSTDIYIKNRMSESILFLMAQLQHIYYKHNQKFSCSATVGF